MGEKRMIKITIDSKYFRKQFDDWLAGGTIEFNGKVYYWTAQDSHYGLGWEIEPVTEEDWSDLNEHRFSKFMEIIERFLCEHKSEYMMDYP